MSTTADQDISIISGLADEIARLRGIGSAGVAPPLDHDAIADNTADMSNHNELEDAEIEETLHRMHSEMQAAKDRAAMSDRSSLQEELLSRDVRAREGREALNSYLEELRARQDETGDALRSSDFASDVQELAQRERMQYDQEDGDRSAVAPADMSSIMQHVQDPATLEALREVQRLDSALAQTESQQEAGTFLTEASAVGGTPSSPAKSISKPPDRAALGASVSALHQEIGRLKGIDGGRSASDLLSSSAASTEASVGDSKLTVGGRRLVGGKWITQADEARIEALLAEVDYGEDGATEEEFTYGEGYMPSKEVAERLATIDSQLEEHAAQRAFTDGPDRTDGPDLPAELRPALAVGSASNLETMKQERAEAAALGHIRDRLAELHATPLAETAKSKVEAQMVADMLAMVRHEAERMVDSRPSTARPLSARLGGGGAGYGDEIVAADIG
mmetsp:Transcript_5149/g.13559  ORF Transcript_5149/g.13559 Transcript_5149/m.13559 type:complete len:450 (+) Transcript_5149:83-1432(+)|eukprot:CAMPEP_0115848310 /NCGR_PEP_ID=MMETSP0287-20121206/10855_1 /TAXON_ID=412157 /ORGANISM="Chrysochromulina rotalis, Strain UIO044" /LENGTH=449 /DNA_ID=CAMNT_0003302217 /DNA_START=58 /DNA_END=1407 /DNA_ORIENTATION=-